MHTVKLFWLFTLWETSQPLIILLLSLNITGSVSLVVRDLNSLIRRECLTQVYVSFHAKTIKKKYPIIHLLFKMTLMNAWNPNCGTVSMQTKVWHLSRNTTLVSLINSSTWCWKTLFFPEKTWTVLTRDLGLDYWLPFRGYKMTECPLRLPSWNKLWWYMM